jgi:hypothetical protein
MPVITSLPACANELEVGVVAAELVYMFPSSVLLWKSMPPDADIPHPAALLRS